MPVDACSLPTTPPLRQQCPQTLSQVPWEEAEKPGLRTTGIDKTWMGRGTSKTSKVTTPHLGDETVNAMNPQQVSFSVSLNIDGVAFGFLSFKQEEYVL